MIALRVSSIPRLFFKGAWSILKCARGTSTFLSCASTSRRTNRLPFHPLLGCALCGQEEKESPGTFHSIHLETPVMPQLAGPSRPCQASHLSKAGSALLLSSHFNWSNPPARTSLADACKAELVTLPAAWPAGWECTVPPLWIGG
jgi:hypothetical protein